VAGGYQVWLREGRGRAHGRPVKLAERNGGRQGDDVRDDDERRAPHGHLHAVRDGVEGTPEVPQAQTDERTAGRARADGERILTFRTLTTRIRRPRTGRRGGSSSRRPCRR